MELTVSTNHPNNNFLSPRWNSNPIRQTINKSLHFSQPIQKKLRRRISNLAAANNTGYRTGSNSKSDKINNNTLATTRTSSLETEMETVAMAAGNGKPRSAGNGNTALEQLDFERGVCIPFRKYSPQTVRRLTLYC